LPTARWRAISKMPFKLRKNTMPRRFAPRRHLSISLNVKLGGVCLKISERNWLDLAGGIPPKLPFRPPRFEPEWKGKLPKNLSKMLARTL